MRTSDAVAQSRREAVSLHDSPILPVRDLTVVGVTVTPSTQLPSDLERLIDNFLLSPTPQCQDATLPSQNSYVAVLAVTLHTADGNRSPED